MAEYNPSKIIKDGNTYNFRDTTKIPLSGSNQISGSLIPATDNAYNLGDSTYGFASFYVNKIYLKGSTIFNVADDNYICVGGATAQANGANLVLNGKNRSTNTGEFKLEARDGTNVNQLIGKPNGTLSWSGRRISSNSNSDELNIDGGTGYASGATLWLTGKNNSVHSGYFTLIAHNGTNEYQLQGTPSGTLTWNNKNVAMQEDVVPRSGGAVMTGEMLGRNVNNSEFRLCAGTSYENGASVVLYGKNIADPNYKGRIFLCLSDGLNSKNMNMYPSGTWTWNGTACQITSDQRLKQQITEIDDKLLDAWEDVELSQFKYNDAVEEKSDNARLHTGYVVQQIDEACKSHNVDISKYGLYCHEEYAEETREVEQADGTKTTEVVRPANEHYSLRYTEALIVECAYLRKCIKELRTEIEQLKSSK